MENLIVALQNGVAGSVPPGSTCARRSRRHPRTTIKPAGQPEFGFHAFSVLGRKRGGKLVLRPLPAIDACFGQSARDRTTNDVRGWNSRATRAGGNKDAERYSIEERGVKNAAPAVSAGSASTQQSDQPLMNTHFH
jgi:hypothetical protein